MLSFIFCVHKCTHIAKYLENTTGVIVQKLYKKSVHNIHIYTQNEKKIDVTNTYEDSILYIHKHILIHSHAAQLYIYNMDKCKTEKPLHDPINARQVDQGSIYSR